MKATPITILLTLPLFAGQPLRIPGHPEPLRPPGNPCRRKQADRLRAGPDMERVAAAVRRLCPCAEDKPLPPSPYKLVVRSTRRPAEDSGRRRYMTGGLGDHGCVRFGNPVFYQD